VGRITTFLSTTRIDLIEKMFGNISSHPQALSESGIVGTFPTPIDP